MPEDFTELEDKLGVKFKNPELLKTALTHRSYINENPEEGIEHNERMEFLGDAVLELSVTEYLYENYNLPEGELTNLRAAVVRGEMLSKVAKDWHLNDHLRLSRGEKKDTGKARQFILANTVEAVIGAVYLDQGYESARDLVLRDIASRLKSVVKEGLHIDAKSRFQELAQERFRKTPAYKILEETGPDHSKSFRVGVFLGEEKWEEGGGSSKQEAEQAAARKAIAKLEQSNGK